jgi:hypothetical protein
MVDGGLSILQYADDTILFLEHDFDKARNMKLILSTFAQLSGLNINCIALVRPKTRSMFKPIYLAVGRANFL